MWEHLIVGIPAGWSQRTQGAVGGVTGVALPTLNGVWAYRQDAERHAVRGLLERVALVGVPHCLQLAPACTGELRPVAQQLGMRRDVDIPLMVLASSRALSEPDHGDLAIEELEPEQALSHVEIAAAGFGAAVEPFAQLMTPAVLARPGVRTYVGKIAGQAVATGIGVSVMDHVGVFNVATLPTYRRHGYGAAITSRAVRDGLGAGARWAWLQSTPAGYSVYEGLGFRTAASWDCWIAT